MIKSSTLAVIGFLVVVLALPWGTFVLLVAGWQLQNGWLMCAGILGTGLCGFVVRGMGDRSIGSIIDGEL